MAYTQDDLDKLERALATRVRRVTFSDGRTAEFSTFDELVKRISYVRQQLGKEATTQRKLAEYTKGVKC